MARQSLIRIGVAAAALASLSALLWWAVVGSARIATLPPAPPDEGREQQLYSAYLEALVRRRPEHWQARVNLAATYVESGRAPFALAQLREAHRIRPDDPE